MRRLLPLTLAAMLAIATPAAAGWSADRTQTRAGSVFRVNAAGGNGDRVALGWARVLGRTQRAEVRLGRARDGLSGAVIVMDSQRGHSVEAAIPAYDSAGAFDVAWRRYRAGTHRIRRRGIDRDRHLGAAFELTTTGESAYDPAWVLGPSRALIWSRRTRADGVEFLSTGPRGVRLPVAPLSEPGAATDANGLATVSWVDGGRVLVSDRTASGFSTPFVLATGSVDRPRVVRTGGATLVLWRQDTNLMVVARPSAGAAFGPAREVLASTTDSAQVAVTRTGEVLVVAPVRDSTGAGALQLARLGKDGASLGTVRFLGRGRRAALVADGTGSAFVAWIDEQTTRAVSVRRIAGGGILGSEKRLAERSDLPVAPAVGATREGGAVLAWIAGGDVHARTYRP